MEQDGRRFGQATWASALPRLERIKSMLAKETLQHMRSKEMCLNQKRADITQKVRFLEECKMFLPYVALSKWSSYLTDIVQLSAVH